MAEKQPTTAQKCKALAKGLFSLYLIYLGLSLVLIYGIKDKLVLQPMKDVSWRAYLPQLDSILKSKTTNLRIPSQGSEMDALYIKVPGAEKLILVTHGNAGNLGHRVPLGAILGKCGASVLLFDYRGYGESSGSPSCDNVLADGLSAYDYAVNTLGYKPQNIVLYGESIGCSVATYIMENRKAGKVILQSPFVSLGQTARDKLFFLAVVPGWVQPSPAMDNLSPLIKPHAPLLLIHGDKDTILPIKYSETLMAQAAAPKQFYISPGEGHNDIATKNMVGVVKTIKAFLEQPESENKQAESQSKQIQAQPTL